MIPRLLRTMHGLAWLTLGVGMLLQFGIKDRYPGIALFFYAMPKPCLLGLAITLLLWPIATVRSRFLAASIAIGIGSLWWQGSWQEPRDVTSERHEDEEVRILYWNLCRPSGLHPQMIELMKQFQPHFAAFVEPGKIEMEKKCREYEAQLPGYQAAWMPRGILWLSRVPSRYRERGKLENIGAFARFEVRELGPTFEVVVADVHPHPLHSRQKQLEEVLAHAHGRSDAILMGDFNTPLESIWLDPIRQSYTHALEVAGQGFKETWPLGLPLLSLDHLWVGRDWKVVEARKVWRVPASDHAALLVTLVRSKESK